MERGKTDERGQLTTKILDRAAREDQGSRLQTASAELGRMVGAKLYDGEASIERSRITARAEKLSIPFRAALEVFRRNGGSSALGLEALAPQILDRAAKEDQGSPLQNAADELGRMVGAKLYDRKTTST